MSQKVHEILQTVIQPLIEADGGSLCIMEESPIRLVLRLSGACAGCPGFSLTSSGLIEPLLRPHLAEGVEIIIDNTAILLPSASSSNPAAV